MRNKYIIAFVLTLIALTMLVSCLSEQTIEQKVTEDVNVEEGYPLDRGYPPPQVLPNQNESGYPIREYDSPPIPTLSFDSSLGNVTGRILHSGKPVVGYNVYLADILMNNQGEETTASLKRSSSPQAILGAEGNFVFNEIPPGRYALMLVDGVNSYLLLQPRQADEEAILLDVSPGELIDLGELDYLDFPAD